MRILFVAMANSIHTARWISQLNGQGWDIHVFDALESTVSPELTGVTAHVFHRPRGSQCNAPRVRSDERFPVLAGFLRNRFPAIARLVFPSWGETLPKLIRALKPDIIHSLEMQNESYALLEASCRLGGSFDMPWIYSSWGSDIYLFGMIPEHRARVRAVLEACDYYIADCHRDVELALKYGLRGEVLGVLPAAGGFDIAGMQRLAQPGPASSRRVIALKGYTGWAGRALVALRALQLCADRLESYEVVIYLAGMEVEHIAHYLSEFTGLRLQVLPPSPNQEILKLMGRARIAIGVSVSDGTPSSLLEAMVMGAFPIQSDTVSTAEWITHGENGLLVPPDDAETIAAAIRRSLSDDALVDKAAELNARITAERVDRNVIQPQVIRIYEKVFANGRRTRVS